MQASERLLKLTTLFEQLYALMLREGEDNWINGIGAIIDRLKCSSDPSENTPDKLLRSVSSSYRSMNAGYGSFSEFFIWREDYQERLKANKELDALKMRIFELLDFD